MSSSGEVLELSLEGTEGNRQVKREDKTFQEEREVCSLQLVDKNGKVVDQPSLEREAGKRGRADNRGAVSQTKNFSFQFQK